MKLFKKNKPTTPSTRHALIISKNVTKRPLLKTKIKKINQALGKSKISGRTVCRHKEAGEKRKYRKLSSAGMLDLKRTSAVLVCAIEYDPYRSAFIMAVFNKLANQFHYLLAPEGISAGFELKIGADAGAVIGNTTILKNIPVGNFISNVSSNPRREGTVARSAGTYCVVRAHLNESTLLEFPSGELKIFSSLNHAILGKMSNWAHFLERKGKAGRSRWLGKRPTVRGVAMNPVDHPNGGGEGKKSGPKKTPWGKPSRRSKPKKLKTKILYNS